MTKLNLTFKTPDVLDDAAREKARQAMDDAAEDALLDNEDLSILYNETYYKLMEEGKKWVKDGEYITVEIDIEAGTCKVRPV